MMDRQKLLRLIAALSNANGASGFEDDVVEVLREHTAGLGEQEEDRMRNFYLRRPGADNALPTVMLDAHTDEVSFMVRAIHPNGTLKFICLGGWVNCNLPAHRVRVRTEDGSYVPGVIVSKPPHFMSAAERQQMPAVEDLAIDIGALSADEVTERFRVRIGAPVVPDVEMYHDAARDLLIGKAFDCRLGCAAAVSTMEQIKDDALEVNVTASFSTQEEVGSRGASVSVHRIKPNLAIVFEGCPADDTFGESYAMQTKIKHGPYLRHIDARMITHPRFQRFALDLAREKQIPVQEGVRTGGSTDGAPIHVYGNGVPTIVIGVPVRYIHTHHGIACVSDVEQSAALAREVLRALDREALNGF